MTIFATGNAGFIGSDFVLDWLGQNDEPVVSFGKLTYVGSLNSLANPDAGLRHHFKAGDSGGSEWAVCFRSGLVKIVACHLVHQDWRADINGGFYRNWVARHDANCRPRL